jgi:outer membrane protein TolC
VAALTLLVLGLILPGCYDAAFLKADRSLTLWRTMKSEATPPKAVAPTDKALTLDEALARAMAENPRLRSLRAQIPVGEARIEVASDWTNPQFRLSEVALNDMIDGEPTMEFALRFRFERPGTLGAQAHAAELEVQGLRARIERDEERVKRALERSFLRHSILAQKLLEVDKEIQFRLAHVALVKERLAAGVGVELDLALATLPHGRALDARETLKARQGDVVEEIRALIGAAPSETLRPLVSAPQLTEREVEPSEEEMIELAMGQRPELRQAAARLGRATARAHIARAERWPWPRFAQINYELRHPLEPVRFGFAVGVDLPVFNSGGDRVAMREAQVNRMRIQEEDLIREIARQVARAHRQVQRRRARLAGLKAHLLPAAEHSGAALKRALDAGAGDPLRTTLVEGRRVRARRAYLDALADYHEALINLDAAAGIRR